MLNARATIVAFGLGIAMFAAMLLFLELGRRVGIAQMEKRGDASRTGVGKADAPVYALLALLIGFTFSGAGARFDHRRELVSQQVNAVSTAWDRIEALPAAAQPDIRAGVRRYVDALLATYRSEPTRAEALRESAEVSRARGELWSRAVSVSLTAEGEKARMLLLPSMNEMFDAAESELLARRIHPPRLIFVMLGISALAGALFAGYGLASGPARNWMYMIGIAATVAIAMYAIVELEYPRLGLVRVDATDQALTDLRATMQ
jgi:hypothetical protein